ncbi:MAG: NAD-dependent isocitrate dehydrogenase [Bacteroidetes bacterium]|nr:NAD-dependent isocitrate dehydrogenase [Bacteroidota bacterium]MCW5896139.1 NAD-dependent isocitrate dehydrogenase [Bacteroidota bacterium]
MHRVTLIPGDGIGPSISESTTTIIKAAGVNIQWDIVEAGLAAIDKYRDPLPPNVIESIKSTKIALKGPLTTPVGSGFRSVNVALRKEFDLYSNVRPARSFEGVPARYEGIDLVIVRENTEEFYAGIEHYIDPSRSAAETIGIVTRMGSERILRYAYEYARKHGRKKVTTVHKANILKYTGGLFLDVAHEVAKQYPDIVSNDKIVDNMAMQMVTNPHQFDVIVTTNLFGDILSDLASGLVGGLGLAPGSNIGYDVAIFEAVHGSAPDIAGKNIANPCALILAGVMMLRHIGEESAAERIENAVSTVLKEGKYVTADLKPAAPVRTTEMTQAIVNKLK